MALPAIPLPSRLGFLALAGSGLLLLGALYFQYVKGLPPCDLCYWQRWPHIATVLAGAGALAFHRNRRLVLPLLLIAIAGLIASAGIGAFHAGVEYGWWQGPQSCGARVPSGLTFEELKKYLFDAPPVRCDQPAWSMAGISMAGWNALISAALAFLLAAGVANPMRRAA